MEGREELDSSAGRDGGGSHEEEICLWSRRGGSLSAALLGALYIRRILCPSVCLHTIPDFPPCLLVALYRFGVKD